MLLLLQLQGRGGRRYLEDGGQSEGREDFLFWFPVPVERHQRCQPVFDKTRGKLMPRPQVNGKNAVKQTFTVSSSFRIHLKSH